MHQTCMILTDIQLENEYTDRNDDLNFVVWKLLGIDAIYRCLQRFLDEMSFEHILVPGACKHCKIAMICSEEFILYLEIGNGGCSEGIFQYEHSICDHSDDEVNLMSKADVPNSVTCLDRTPIFEWCVVRYGSKNRYSPPSINVTPISVNPL